MLIIVRTIIAAALVNTLFIPGSAYACAPVPRPGQFVRIAEESAIIVWDEATHTEHFIRQATFDTDAADFGFLVPTPTVPQLAEVDNAVFTDLEYRIRPETIVQTKRSGVDLTPLVMYPFLLLRTETGRAPVRGVEVLSTQRVAGYDAVVLKADGASELNRWLGEHGYASSPSLTEWLKPYVASRWNITAFKIAKQKDDRVVATSAVRMSFTTDRPFFPYREPADQNGQNEAHDSGERLLRVFCLSGSRLEGMLGRERTAASPGRTVWADKVSDRRIFGKVLPPESPLADSAMWLSVFEDTSSPRPGTDDLYFAPDAQQEIVHFPPVVNTVYQRIPVPLDVLLVLLLLVGGMILVMRKKKRPAIS